MIARIEAIEEAAQGAALAEITNGIKAFVRSKGFEEAGIIIAKGTQMQLHGPTAGVVHATEFDHDRGLKLLEFTFAGGFAGAGVEEDMRDLRRGKCGEVAALQTAV